MSIFKRKKKDKFPTATGPRPLETIKQEYGALRAQAGDIQYQQYIHAEDLRRVNERLLKVNQEAQERMSLDKQLAEAAKAAPVETNQQ